MSQYISHAAHVLPVENLQESVSFYKDVLGFTIEFEWGEPIDYVIISSGKVAIHLNKKLDSSSASEKHTRIYLFVSEIDQFYEEILKKGAQIKTPIGTRDYGMRDFDIVDPDGYILSFGMGVT